MDLRNFHILFICVSILLAVAFGAWAISFSLTYDHTGYLVAGIVSIAVALGLVAYGQWFLRKMRRIRPR